MKAIGLVPEDVERMYIVAPRMNVDPTAIPVGYLASVAYEWDSWGLSTPMDFVRAMAVEFESSNRGIMELLASVGSTPQDMYELEVAA